MEQHILVRWLKILVIFMVVFGVALFVGILPMEGKQLIVKYPEFAYCYYPWLIFLWILAIPCFAALRLAWKIFVNIERDHSFCMENADYLKKISFLAGADSGILFLGNVLFLLLSMNHPGILLGMLLIVIFGIGVSVAAAVLSHLVRKAAVLQEQSDLTI
ncbi:MAG: DUF2975 domain-containing protein [Lachnospiraceae bacterium]